MLLGILYLLFLIMRMQLLTEFCFLVLPVIKLVTTEHYSVLSVSLFFNFHLQTCIIRYQTLIFEALKFLNVQLVELQKALLSILIKMIFCLLTFNESYQRIETKMLVDVITKAKLLAHSILFCYALAHYRIQHTCRR